MLFCCYFLIVRKIYIVIMVVYIMTSINKDIGISSPRYIQKGYIQKGYINQNIKGYINQDIDSNISNDNLISNNISKVYSLIGSLTNSLVGYRLLKEGLILAHMLNKSYPVPNQLNNGGLYK